MTSVVQKLTKCLNYRSYTLYDVVVLVFYGPSTVLRYFRVRSVNLSTQFLGCFSVLSAHSFASNWQLPFLNQQKGENGCRNYFMTNLHEQFCRARGSNLRPSAYQADAHLSYHARLILYMECGTYEQIWTLDEYFGLHYMSFFLIKKTTLWEFTWIASGILINCRTG